jgi:hypothetical protein
LGTRACGAQAIPLSSGRVSPGWPRRAWAGSSVVEHSTFNRVVVGSTPTRPTPNSALSISIQRALALKLGLGYRLYMRRAALLALAAASLLSPSLATAQTSSASAPAPPASKPSQDDRLLTPEQMGRQGMTKGVLEQPFRDFGLVRSKIPPVLIAAMADPYARPAPASCDGIAADMTRLNIALGPDLDEPVSTEHPGVLTRGERGAKTAALDAMRSEAQSQIPFDGFIRVLSGADRHDHLVMAAIQAGAIRRGYLKGLGEMRQCMPPDVPRHLAHPVSIAETVGTKSN